MRLKRLISAFIACAMLFTMVPSYALADDSSIPITDIAPATSAKDVEVYVPDTTACTMAEGCTAEVHQDGCPTAQPAVNEPQEEQTPCTKTEGCTLFDGHEGDCDVPEAEPEQKMENRTVWQNESVETPVKPAPYLEQSETVSVKVTTKEFQNAQGKSKTGRKLIYTIEEGAQGVQTLVLDNLLYLYDPRNPDREDYMPGDSNLFEIEIRNESGNVYRVKKDSFVMQTADTSDNNGLVDTEGFDGQKLPLSYISGMVTNKALKALFDTSSVDLTLEQTLGLYGQLAEKGYDSLTEYFVEYYSGKYHTEYTDFDDMIAQNPSVYEDLQSGNGNGYSMTREEADQYQEEYPEMMNWAYVTEENGNQLKVQFKWPEAPLQAAGYNGFYQSMFAFAFGTDAEKLNPNSNHMFCHERGVGDYMTDNALQSQTRTYFEAQTSENYLTNAEDSVLTYTGAWGLDGPCIQNAYANYDFSYYAALQLEPVGHKVQYYFEGHYPEEAELPEAANYQTGAAVEIAEAPEEVEDWKFLGWTVWDTIEVSEEGTFEMPDRDVAIVGRWEFVGEETSTDWEVSKSKTATNLDENYESQVTLSLPSSQETLESDVVFVLDKSTSADVEDQMLEMLENLNAQTEETGAVINVGVVIFNKEAHTLLPLTQLSAENMSTIQEAIKTDISSGTNTHAGLLAGKAMLDADTNVDANRKYLVFVSDGITYMYNETPTVTAWSFFADAWNTWAGPDNWNSKYDTNKAPNSWDTWMADIGAKVDTQGTTYEYPYGGTAQVATPQKNWQTAYANSIDKALYLTNSVYQDAQAAGYHCYALKATSNANYAWASSFMDYLADGEEVSFDDIQNDIYYLLDAGSRVVDVIGSGSDYNFDFVDKVSALSMKVGDDVLTAEKIADDPQFTDMNATSIYGFSREGEFGNYPFVLLYYANGQDGKSEECFVWQINENVSNFAPVQLTYTVKLTNPKTEPGTYGEYDADGSQNKDSLYTNNSATLYPVDSNGDHGTPENFAKPTVSYTVEDPTITVTFKPGAHGDLRGAAAGADISYDDIKKGNGLGADQVVPRVDEDKDWDFTKWLCTEGPAGMKDQTYTAAQIAELEFDVDTVFVAQYEEESSGGGAHHPEYDPDDDNDRDDDDEEEIIDEEVPLAETPWLNTVDHYAYIVGYPEDYVTGQPTEDESRWPVKPQANISRAEVATIFFRLLTDEARDQFWMTTNNFPDVAPDAWYNNAISTMVNAGIIQGYEDGTFRPNNNITRAEFAAIASRFMSSGYDVEEDLFTDIANHWARENINDAAMTQWIHGYPDGTFLPDQAITRAEAVTLVNNVLQRKPHKDHMLDSMIKWPDNPESAWYYEAIQEATNSHDYDLFEDAEYETWTALQENRDWAALEKDWVNTHRTGGEVA